MSGLDLLYAVLSLLFVLGLVGGVALIARHSTGLRARLTAGRGASTRRKRLQVMETAAVDTRRRLVLVRCDDREHLLLIGGQNDLVVDRNVAATNKETRP